MLIRLVRRSLPALLLIGAMPVAAQQAPSCPSPVPIVGTLAQPMAAVRYLADDALEGRLSGTEGELCTARYIAQEFARIGLAPAFATGYAQPVPLQSAVGAHLPGSVGANVVGVLEGSDPVLRGEAIVVGAHHDHLGRGEVFGSLAPPDSIPAIHNGADDNASGVGALLAVAEALASGPRPARSVVFITFTGEELGLIGSAYYAANPAIPLERTVAMLNMDMVGRLDGDPLIVNGTGTASEWDGILDEMERRLELPLTRAPDGFGPSDHTSFYARGVPVLHFFTNVHGQYHRPSDEWRLIDEEGLHRIASMVGGIVLEVGNRPTRITPLAGAGTPPQERQGGGGDRAYLGSIPDFAPVEYGVRFSGVTGGSPADEAGMLAGDILIRLGEHEIDDLYALTAALERLRPGDAVAAVVVRGGEPLTLQVVIGSR
jgi:hypothetical protein